ncbi:MAG: TraB/GumN family protein [Tunicatimonas sp.]|uniref:TraB/GumN family protein n=1 Tax=Tunicatimonas sp. TaxID=1940096 RepID=UPI003C751FAF
MSKAGVEDTSYLFGTFHTVNPDFFLSLPNSVKKLEEADILFVERTTVDSNTTLSEDVKLNYWSVERWDNLLDKEQKRVFESFVEKSEDQGYYDLPPSILALNLAQLYTTHFCDIQDRESYEALDSFIVETALNSNKEIRSLDENQLNILLRSSLSSTSEEDSVYAAMCAKYMDRMLNDDLSGCEQLEDYKNLNIDYQLEKENHDHPFELTERNDKWITIIQKALKENSCFVAVGFRHLQYKQGLIQQLRESGYSVEPIAAR